MKLSSRIVELIRELRRRRVLQAAAVYATGAFIAVQVADVVFPALQFPSWTQSLVVILALVGFPVVVAIWWAYEVTPEGIRRTVEQEEGAEVLHARGTPWTALALVAVVTVASAGVGWASWDLWLDVRSEARAEEEFGESTERMLAPTRVAVLPFEVSQGEDLRRVAQGLSRDLSHQLGKVDTLDVVSELGTRPYGESDLPPDSIARSLNAGSLVTGSIEALGDRIRLRVQLVDGESGKSLMNSEFSGPRDSILSLRDDLVAKAVRQLRRRLGEEVELERIQGGTPHVRAWRLYHQAENIVQRADSLRHAGATELAGQFYERADSLYRSAREFDQGWVAPGIARGWLAYKQGRLGGQRISAADPEWFRSGLEIADRLLGEQPGDAAALELRGVLRSWLSRLASGDSANRLREQAGKDLRTAVTREPERARAWVELADVLRVQGEFREARAAWKQAREADAFLSNDGDVLHMGTHLALEFRDLETVFEWTGKGQRRYPQSATYPQFRLLAYPMDGAPRVAPDSVWSVLREFERRVGGTQPYARIWVAAALARFGYADSARMVLDRAREGARAESRHIPYYEAKVWLNLGETARAISELQEAVEEHGYPPREYLAEDPWWMPLRDDPRFRALVAGGE